MPPSETAPGRLLRGIWNALERPESELSGAVGPRHPVPLPAHTDVPALAWSAVAAASCAAASLTGRAVHTVDPDRVAVAYRSRVEIDGVEPAMFSPMSGFFRTVDGWVRTHANYPHHSAALRLGFGLSETATREQFAERLIALPTDQAVELARRAGALCVPVLTENPREDERLRSAPVIELRHLADAEPRPLPGRSAHAPLRGVRVLDLTRVIAGPVGTRTLAFLGADVLRIDPPHLPELEPQHFDTGHGKRSALLDLASPEGLRRFDELLADADVVALGYRPSGLTRLGITPHALARQRPGLIVAQHSAWSDPDRRGFDSLVQPASGIALVEGTPEAPGTLPVQALDHTTGYLLAAGVMTALARRSAEGGSWLVSTSLRRIAAELLGLPRSPTVRAAQAPSWERHSQTFEVDGRRITTAAPAIAYPGGPSRFRAPRPWGGDGAEWSA